MKKLKFLLAAGFAFFMLSMAENKKTGERRTYKMLLNSGFCFLKYRY